jgi:hypothetical protein
MRGLPVTLMLSLCALGLSAPVVSAASVPTTGGTPYDDPAAPAPTVPGDAAQIVDGRAVAPEAAPTAVKRAIVSANQIIGKPYVYGGGHTLARAVAAGYDCSGTVSFALRGAKLLKTPLDSSSFTAWGRAGRGTWITVYTNPGHAFAVIGGLRLDTSAAGDPSGAKGPRWRPVLRSTHGFAARHPKGL